MRVYPVKFEVREATDGWRLFAVPCHNIGWEPIPMTPPRGTPGGALVEFASALYQLTSPADAPPVSPRGDQEEHTKDDVTRTGETYTDPPGRATAPTDTKGE